MKYRVGVFIFMALFFVLTQSIYGMRNKEVRLYSPKHNTTMKKIFYAHLLLMWLLFYSSLFLLH